MRARLALVMVMVLAAAGCAHEVALETPTYAVPRSAPDDGLVLVIDPATEKGLVPIKPPLTLGLNTFYAQPGAMLRQAADHDLGLMFGSYDVAPLYREPVRGSQRITVFATIPNYAYTDGKIDLEVRVKAFSPGRNTLFDKSYKSKSGNGSGLNVGGLGIEGLILQASADAYAQVMAQLRADLADILAKQQALPKGAKTKGS